MKYTPPILSCSNENFCFHVGDYSFGFNGKELDKEGMGGGASTYDYGFRIYNSALAKFLSVDPLKSKFPWYTPYQFAGNKPIIAIDLDGLEEQVIIEVFTYYTDPKLETFNFVVVQREITYLSEPGPLGDGVLRIKYYENTDQFTIIYQPVQEFVGKMTFWNRVCGTVKKEAKGIFDINGGFILSSSSGGMGGGCDVRNGNGEMITDCDLLISMLSGMSGLLNQKGNPLSKTVLDDTDLLDFSTLLLKRLTGIMESVVAAKSAGKTATSDAKEAENQARSIVEPTKRDTTVNITTPIEMINQDGTISHAEGFQKNETVPIDSIPKMKRAGLKVERASKYETEK